MLTYYFKNADCRERIGLNILGKFNHIECNNYHF